MKLSKFRQIAEGIIYYAPDHYSSADLVDVVEAAIIKAVAEEREACALVAERYTRDGVVRDAIRARSQDTE